MAYYIYSRPCSVLVISIPYRMALIGKIHFYFTIFVVQNKKIKYV